MIENLKETRRHVIILAMGACIYALLYSLGSQIEQSGQTEIGTTALRFACALLPALVICAVLLHWGIPCMRTWAAGGTHTKPFCTGGALILIFCCYVPMFLIEYPGSYTYDTARQVGQIASGEYNTFHPLLHTLLLSLCLSAYDLLQSLEKCAALCSLLQMLAMSGCFALTCASISRTVSRRAARCTVAFFCLYPAHMAFASNYTKDALFAALLVLFLSQALEYLHFGHLSRGRMALLLASGTLACLMRNNMIYAMAVWGMVLLVRWRHLRQMALCALAVLALYAMGNAGLRTLTSARDGRVIEMYSIPIQQMARARLKSPESFTPQEAETMDTVYGELYLRYAPTISDPIKDLMDEETFIQHKAQLARVWLSVGLKCPGIYLDAFLHMVLPSIYPYREYRVDADYIEIGMEGNELTRAFDLPLMTQPSRFAGIRTWLEKAVYDTGADDVPLVRWLFNIGGIFWLLLLFWLHALYVGDTARATVLLLVVLLWGTYLLGPVMQGRYLYPFLCTLPLFAFALLQNKTDDLPDKPDELHTKQGGTSHEF